MGADTPEGRFWFYSLRMIYVFWMLGFGLFRHLTCRDETERTRMARGRVAFVVVAVLAALVVAALLFLVLRTDGFMLGPILISSERNYAENLLFLAGALLAIGYAVRSLALRFEKPPADESDERAARIGDNLLIYARRHGLTDRESEVLRLILQGKDNQNIASALTLSAGTVKVHMHNILKKTGHANRAELAADFWER